MNSRVTLVCLTLAAAGWPDQPAKHFAGKIVCELEDFVGSKKLYCIDKVSRYTLSRRLAGQIVDILDSFWGGNDIPREERGTVRPEAV